MVLVFDAFKECMGLANRHLQTLKNFFLKIQSSHYDEENTKRNSEVDESAQYPELSPVMDKVDYLKNIAYLEILMSDFGDIKRDRTGIWRAENFNGEFCKGDIKGKNFLIKYPTYPRNQCWKECQSPQTYCCTFLKFQREGECNKSWSKATTSDNTLYMIFH